MPTLPPVPGVLRLQWTHASDSDTNILNRMFLQYTGTAPTSANLATMAGTVSTNWNTRLASYLSNNDALYSVTITDLSSASGGIGISTTHQSGTRTGQRNALGVAVLMNLKVARRYRGGKPRIYLPYLVAADLSTSQAWVAATITALNTAYSNWVSDIIAAAPAGTTITGQVNVSYYSSFTSVQNPVTHRWKNVPSLRATPLVDSIISHSVNAAPASQRRRNRGTGS